jgi:hypothetical protein
MRENRGPWYLLTGLLIGLIAGIVYARLIEPVQYIDVTPNLLSAEAKDTYRVMIAMAFEVDGNLGRARQRLALLNDSSPAQALSDQAQRMANLGGSEGKALALLADAYNPRPTAQITPTIGDATPVPTDLPTSTPTILLSPTATIDPALAVRTATLPPTMTPTITLTGTPAETSTPRPTLRPTPTLGAPYAFSNKQVVCDPNAPAMLEVEVYDKAGEPVPGVQIRVTWLPNGLDVFYTGLVLEINPGYADFQMAPGIVYAVRAGENGEVVSGLSIQDCSLPEGGGKFQGGVKVTFTQP